MTAVEETTPVVVEETTVVPTAEAEETVVVKPKRDLHRMQRIFRGTKTKLATRPFLREGTSGMLTAVTMAQLKAATADLTAEEVAKALADADPVPALVAEMSARAARFGIAVASSSAVSAEEQATRDEAARRRAERFGVVEQPAAVPIDPTVLAARAARFADPRAEAEKEAAAKRAARFGTSAAPAVAFPPPVELTAEQQAVLDARARRFGA